MFDVLINSTVTNYTALIKSHQSVFLALCCNLKYINSEKCEEFLVVLTTLGVPSDHSVFKEVPCEMRKGESGKRRKHKDKILLERKRKHLP